MTAETVRRATASAIAARGRLAVTLARLQHRLSPGVLAGDAWDGVKEKSAELAESAVDAARRRPAAVSLALGALALFAARAPLKRGLSRWIGTDDKARTEPGSELAGPRLSAPKGVD